MPDLFKLASEPMAWQHWQIRMFALQCLHTRQFIPADRAFAFFGSFNCSCLKLTAFNDFLFPPLIDHFCQPLAEAVRLQPPFLSREEAGGDLVMKLKDLS